ncbi:MAG: PKD domain-containing protein, partial [Saprospiraceae bacterium]|nr:PKD domain-containing protein [Saprospiraceae bacterium]
VYYWSYGNGAIGEGREVKYQYDKAGDYEICLKVVSGVLSNTADPACTKAVCKKVTIGSSCDLDADFIFETVGNIVKLTAKSTIGDAAKYYWSFGNGAAGEGREVKYQYDKPGDYEICLKVVSVLSNTAAQACTKSICKKVSVNTSNNDCNLKIDFNYKTLGLTGIFSAFSNDDSARYYWYVSGQNVQYTGQEITIPFVKDGSYEVCLIAVDGAEKCKLQICKKVPVGNKIKIYPNPAADVLNVASEQIINTALIYNHANELMISFAINQTFGSIDISSLEEGMYIISLQLIDGTVISERFYKK